MVKFHHIAMAVLLATGCKTEKAETLRAPTPAADIDVITAQAIESRGDGKAALWTGADADTQLFIFGTLHNLHKDAKWMTPTLEKAFSASDTIIFETDLTSQTARKTMAQFRTRNGELPAEDSLYQHMDTGDAYRLKSLLKNMGEEPDSFSHLQPWLATLRISQLQMERAGFGISVDSVLEQKARSAEKTISYLENVSDQMQLFDDASFRLQINTLNQITQNLDRSFQHLDLIASEWLDGDVHGLGLLVANPDFGYDADGYAAILVARNQKWSAKIESLMDQPGTHLIAVGAAHLAGPDSLIQFLETKNIEMERVP